MTDSKRELHEMLKDFDTAMLVTRAQDGMFRARPMVIAQVEPEGDMWFITSLESPKIDELLVEPRCAAVMQSGRKQMCISGHAEIVRDRGKIEALWKDEHGAWVEDGKNSLDAVLIHLRAEEAEYWDRSAAKLLRLAFQIVKGMWHKEPVDTEKVDTGTRASS